MHSRLLWLSYSRPRFLRGPRAFGLWPGPTPFGVRRSPRQLRVERAAPLDSPYPLGRDLLPLGSAPALCRHGLASGKSARGRFVTVAPVRGKKPSDRIAGLLARKSV